MVSRSKLFIILACLLGLAIHWSTKQMAMNGSQLNDFAVREEVEPSVVKVINYKANAVGTGFVIEDKQGQRFILTNRHVCEGGDKYEQEVFDILRVPADVVKVSKKYDLCLMTAPKGMRPVELTDRFYWGQMAYIAGHPNGYRFHVTEGKVADITLSEVVYRIGLFSEQVCLQNKGVIKDIIDEEETPTNDHVCETVNRYIVISALTEGGDSGSPVVTSDGEVIGIIAQKDHNHWGLAIPVGDIKDFLKEK